MAETTTLPTGSYLWAFIRPYWPNDPPRKTGRKRIDARRAQRHPEHGLQWNQLPREFGDDATLQRWEELDLFDKLWVSMLVIPHLDAQLLVSGKSAGLRRRSLRPGAA